MQLDSSIRITVELHDREFEIHEVPFSLSYEYSPGSRYARNGDPGEPPSEDVEVVCTMGLEEAVECIQEDFLANSEAVPAWVDAEGSSILHAIRAECCREVRNRLYDFVL